jgi:hypothetical protein
MTGQAEGRMIRRCTAAMLGSLGVTVLLASTWLSGGSASARSSAASVRHRGAVTANGTQDPVAPTGASPSDSSNVVHWNVVHSSTGRYLVELTDMPVPGSVTLELDRWDVTAQAVVTPSAGTTVTIAFDRAGTPVDTPFAFTLTTRQG